MVMQRLGWSILRSVLFLPRELMAFRSLIPTSVAFKVTAVHFGTWLATIDGFTFTYQFALNQVLPHCYHLNCVNFCPKLPFRIYRRRLDCATEEIVISCYPPPRYRVL